MLDISFRAVPQLLACGRQQGEKVTPSLPMPFDIYRLAFGELVIRRDDAYSRRTVVEPRRAKGAAELQPKFGAVARVDRLKDVDRPAHRVDQRQDLWPAAPLARPAHRLAVRLRRHVVLLRRGGHQLGDGNVLVALQVEGAIAAGSQRVDGQRAQCAHALRERRVVHVQMLALVLKGDADGNCVEEAVARALHLCA
eukprot:6185892-Pleurochrysis_carterae.AAC.1